MDALDSVRTGSLPVQSIAGRRAAFAEAGRADYISAFRAWTNAVESELAVPWSAWTDDARR